MNGKIIKIFGLNNMLKLELTNETKSKVGKKSFSDRTKKFYKTLKKVIDGKLSGCNGLVDLVIVDDDTMKAMNAEYRKKNSPTDVLTFAYLEITEYEDDDEGDVIAADIFISIDTAKAQAKEKGHTILKEMHILFVHGLLHAFGFDHNTDEEEAEMEKWAKKILKD
jgi:probable rRNA maturation factor